MPVYKYVGRTRKGGLKRGTIDSESRNQAIIELREKGITPREVVETKETIFNKNITIGGNSVKHQHFVVYCRQFATLIRAGISIIDATKILIGQTESKALQKALKEVEAELRNGRSFSLAVRKHPKIFQPIFVNMVRAGEVTGSLDDALERLAIYFEKQYNLKKKIQSTMAYPIVLLAVTIAVVVFLMLTVIPNFTSMFDSFGAELPPITKLVVSLSEFIEKLWWLALLILSILIIGFSIVFKNNERFRYFVHIGILRMPIFGPLLQKAAIARLTRTLASLFSSSVPILQALSIVEKIVGNLVIEKVVNESRESLEKGSPLSVPFERSWAFPPLVSQMMAIGEQTGSLDFMLEKVANFYEEEVDRAVDTLKSLIEPLMIIFLAVIVGFIVLAIMIPMFSIFSEIQ